MDAHEQAFRYLERDRLHHIDMLEALKRGEGELLYAGEDGVLIFHREGLTYMLSTEDEKALAHMCALLDAPELLTLHQARFAPLLAERFGLARRMDCRQCAYLSSDAPPEKPAPGVTLRALEPENLGFVLAHYSHSMDSAYLSGRIAEEMLGIFVGGTLAGFIGTHAEGTMGMLEVLPEYRRMGLAYTLEAVLIGRQLARGYVPHAQIVCHNTASLRLQEKLGMAFSEQTLVWLYND